MIFSSISFLFYFLPVYLLGISMVGNTPYRLPFLTVASLGFYAWGEPVFLAVMLISILGNHMAGAMVSKAATPQSAWRILVLAVATNLAALALLKYAHFIAVSVDRAFPLPQSLLSFTAGIPLPIGISFFTFQALSYVVDVYRRHIQHDPDLVRFAAYISMFPQLIAGPIVRYVDIETDLRNPAQLTGEKMWSGLRTFALGLGMKVIFANPLGAVADAVFGVPPGQLTAGSAWLGGVSYLGQIYFDFNGYSIMAIGLGRCAGFEFPRNFDDPYLAVSVTDFWRRWHLTLSGFFRDYLYVPLGGNRRGMLRTGVNLGIVFVLCGLWHGAAWNFVVWGIYHGVFLILERLHYRRGGSISGAMGAAYTLVVVLIGWILFRSPSMPHAIEFLKSMAGLGSPFRPVAEFAGPAFGCLLLIAIGVTHVLPQLKARFRVPSWMVNGLAVIAAMLAVWLLVIGTHNPFIYFRF